MEKERLPFPARKVLRRDRSSRTPGLYIGEPGHRCFKNVLVQLGRENFSHAIGQVVSFVDYQDDVVEVVQMLQGCAGFEDVVVIRYYRICFGREFELNLEGTNLLALGGG